MAKTRRPPQSGKGTVTMSPEVRRLLERVAAKLTLRDGRRWTLTATAAEAIRRLAGDKL